MEVSFAHLKYKTQHYAAHGVNKLFSHIAKRSLYENPDFSLIQVKKENKYSVSMRIVIPAHDRKVKKEIEEKGYYALSHVWGKQSDWVLWEDHSIIGTDGYPATVFIREEKKRAILELLHTYDGYWWIDLFCSGSATPPVIMGDVYRLCKRCFALADVPSSTLMVVKDMSKRLNPIMMHDNFAQMYKERIDGKLGRRDLSWQEILDDLFGGWYDYTDRHDVIMLADFLGCRWFNSVWTLQEFVLPCELEFISESGSSVHKLNRSAITPIARALIRIMESVLGYYMVKKFPDYTLEMGYFGFTWQQHQYARKTPGLSRCYFDLTRLTSYQLYKLLGGFVLGECKVDILTLRYVSPEYDILTLLLAHLARLPRTCSDPCDYIYGVVGLLDMDIPRVDDHRQVWGDFKKCLSKRAPCLPFIKNFDLSKARDMQDVFFMFSNVDLHMNMGKMADFVNSIKH
ncbi:hypothetical protein BX666DRAFT_2031991 [Dichotomocladium elegans]|nr:hypothetical protein BX666DRAFT_2031991 [Dichotomocladium elegans]